MRIVVQFSQVFLVLLQCARFVPTARDTGIILPCIEQLQMLRIFPVHRLEREVLVHLGDVPAVHDRARVRLRLANRVARVDELLGELVGELVVLGPNGELAERGAQVTVCAVTHGPDRSRVGRRCGALPEGRSQDEELVLEVYRVADGLEGSGLRPRLRVGDAEACREKLVPDRVLAVAVEREAEVLVGRVREV